MFPTPNDRDEGQSHDEPVPTPSPVSRDKVAEAADDEGPIADAARNIASWAEGDARVYVYQAAKRHLSALALAQPAAGVEGWRWVPQTLTDEMWRASTMQSRELCEVVWSAMLAAAPESAS